MIGTRNGASGGSKAVEAAFGGVGFIAGVGAAIYSYALVPSLALAIFVFAMVSYAVGRALPHVFAEARKAQRALYFASLPLFGTAALYASYLLWESWWVAVLLGFVGGGVAQALLGWALFPKVRKEEADEDLERAGIKPEEWGEPGPEDFGYRSYLRGRLRRRDLPGEPLPRYQWRAGSKRGPHSGGDDRDRGVK